jgi:SAM-dependent methyltransferase
MSRPPDELRAIEERYDRRARGPDSGLYDPLDPYVAMARQEWERALIRCLRRSGLVPLGDKRVLEVGCGGGKNLAELIRLGFRPHNLVGNELRDDRLALARARLPDAVALLPGDASTLDLEDGSFDVVYQSTVFTSILDDDFQQRLAGRMWALTRPGGGILWYDFVWDNPRNPDVRGVPVGRIRRLFPEGIVRRWAITLAPPIGRRLCRVSPALYAIANALPPLRTHVLCWIRKPGPEGRDAPRPG